MLLKTNCLNSVQAVDIIEKNVYEYLKSFGFIKHGRTLHRFVDGDISQIINFQNGCPQKGIRDVLWINLGIRVPECAEMKFDISKPLKKYYHEYDCNIRIRLGELVDNKDTYYNLNKNPKKITKDIIKRLEKHALPVFNKLNSREAIIKYRKDFPDFDRMCSNRILLDEAMIYGRCGNKNEANALFNEYYQKTLQKYKHDLESGTKYYLKKGEKITYHNAKTNEAETITAQKSGYITIYDANYSHLKYLEELAKDLNISLID